MRKVLYTINFSLVLFVLIICTACNSQSSQNFSENIDKYWQDHEISKIQTQRGDSEDKVADIRAQMMVTYGENKENTGEYNRDFAAKTQTGIYVGEKDSNNVVSWKGVPYAKQPVGELRWRTPEEADSDDKVYDAKYFGHSSVQSETHDETSSYYPQGEDCLNLNVWKSDTDKTENKPVMVWLHGGAYIQGGTSDPSYEGANFVKNNPDVIFVTVDYRTDFLGFINLSNVPGADDYSNTANLGLLDIVESLKWIQKNISAFGGDPDKITIFGESAGGGAVSALTIMPQAKGLFNRAIIQSGVASGLLRSKESSIEHTDKIMRICGANNIDDIKSLSVDDIRKIETIINCEDALDYTYPECDGIVLPLDIREALNSNERDGIDIMMGTTKDEFSFWTATLGKEQNLKTMRNLIENYKKKMNADQRARFDKFMAMQGGDEYLKLQKFCNYSFFFSPTRYEAKTHIANGQNAYIYYFTEESSDKDLLSYHGYDLNFLFDFSDESETVDPVAANKLTRTMQRMWINFAKTGNPSIQYGQVEGVGNIDWDKYAPEDYSVMILNTKECKQQKDPVKDQNDLVEDLFWLRIKD